MINGIRIARITQWNINYNAGTTVWGDTDSVQFSNRKSTRKDASGTIEGKFDLNFPQYEIFEPGDSVQLALFEDLVRYWYFTCAVIDEFNYTVNVDTQEVVGWSANWGADGIFFKPGAVTSPPANPLDGPPSLTLPDAPNAGQFVFDDWFDSFFG